MATYRNRNGKWQARIVRKGQIPISKTFIRKSDAKRWARNIEAEMDNGFFINPKLAEKTIFKELIERYIDEVLPSMRGAYADIYRLRAISRKSISKLSINLLSPSKIAEYRDERLKHIKPNTLIRELAYISSIINHARREWGFNISNPVTLVRKPKVPAGRSRILSNEEKILLLATYKQITPNFFNIWMPSIIEFALATAMRLGEITTLLWVNVDIDSRVAFLPMTKNGSSRYVPLSTHAIEILKNLPNYKDLRVFPVNKLSVTASFSRTSRKAQIKNIHFHDLRHTAITNMSGKINNVIELSNITGHKYLSMLKRYIHPNLVDLAKKLD
ncbi:MAG: site-specific integrase [Methylophilaceae bacterium]|nr:site-specific integrase [Methylophilaceae bacterium]